MSDSDIPEDWRVTHRPGVGVLLLRVVLVVAIAALIMMLVVASVGLDRVYTRWLVGGA